MQYEPKAVQRLALYAAAEVANVEIRKANDQLHKQWEQQVKVAAANNLEEPAEPEYTVEYTPESYFDFYNNQVLNSYAQQHKQLMINQAIDRVLQLPEQQQVQVYTIMGMPYAADLEPEGRKELLQALALSKFEALPEEQRNQLVDFVGM